MSFEPAYGYGDGERESFGQPVKLPFDPVRIFLATQRFWYLPLIGGLLFGGVAFFYGLHFFRVEYSDELMFVPNEIPTNLRANEFGESYKPKELDPNSLLSMMVSRRTLAATSRVPSLRNHTTVESLMKNIKLEHDKKTGIIRARYTTTGGRKEVIAVLTAYGKEVENLTRRLQTDEAQDVVRFLNRQLVKAEGDLSQNRAAIDVFISMHGYLDATLEMEADLRTRNDIHMRMQSAHVELATIGYKIDSLLGVLRDHHPLLTRLHQEKSKLELLKSQYTDKNPVVLTQQESVHELEKRIDNELGGGESGDSSEFTRDTFTNAVFLDLLNSQSRKRVLDEELLSMEQFLKTMEDKLEKLPGLAQQYLKLKSEDDRLQILVDLLKARKREAEMYIEEVIPAYKAYEGSVYESVEEKNPTKIFLAVVFFGMAFGASTVFLIIIFFELLNDRVVTVGDMKRATDLPVLAGLTEFSRIPKDTGKWSIALWKRVEALLDERKAGLKEITLSSMNSGEGKTTWIGYLSRAAWMNGSRVVAFVNTVPSEGTWKVIKLEHFLEHPHRVLSEVRESGDAPNPVAVIIHDDWVWTQKNAFLWKRACSELYGESAMVFFLEINNPMLDENMIFLSTNANVFWLSRSGEPRFAELEHIIAMLRGMSTGIRGMFINRLPRCIEQLPLTNKGWIAMALFLGLMTGIGVGSNPLCAAEIVYQKADIRSLEYRLGPGDELDICIYSKPETMSRGVVINPDGAINYLQVVGLQAEGLTVNELKSRLAGELSQYYRPSAVVVIPQAFRSQRYSVLGAVRDPGVYVLDRSVTVLEAIARARGLRTGLAGHDDQETADLSKAFLFRHGDRISIDFEGLLQGKTQLNDVKLQSGDFLCFPPRKQEEVFLMGAVMGPGKVTFQQRMTLGQLIARQGGFSPDANSEKVLILRGGLAHPQPHVVHFNEILQARGQDFPLESGDLVFVSDKPWKNLETLIDIATRAFIGGYSTTIASDRIPSFISR